MTPGICCIIMHDGAGRWGCGGSDVAMGVRDDGGRAGFLVHGGQGALLCAKFAIITT